MDHSRLLVWMDNHAETEREMTGKLCSRHADALVMPRGWTIEDRREPVPLLFASRHLVDTSDPTERPNRDASSSRLRRPRVPMPDAVRSLFDDDVAAESVPPSGRVAVAGVGAAPGSGRSGDTAGGGGATDGNDEETRAIPWTPRLAPSAGATTDEDDSAPTMGRLLGRAYGRRIDKPAEGNR